MKTQDSYTSWLMKTLQTGYVSDLYSIIYITQRMGYIKLSKENFFAKFNYVAFLSLENFILKR